NEPLVNSHSYHGIHADGVQVVDFLLVSNASGRDQMAVGSLSQRPDHFCGKTLQCSFSIYVGIEKAATPAIERLDHFEGRDVGDLPPPVSGYPAADGVESENQGT